MEITVHIQAPELSSAILELANAVGGKHLIETGLIVQSAPTQPVPQQINMPAPSNVVPLQQPYQQAPTAIPITPLQPNQQQFQQAPTTPIPQQQPIQQQMPQQPAQQGYGQIQQPTQQAPIQQPPLQQAPQQPAQGVPTTGPTYTPEQLGVAATQLMDAGKQKELIQLLNSFSVQALTALNKERYGAFATKLREMGARI